MRAGQAYDERSFCGSAKLARFSEPGACGAAGRSLFARTRVVSPARDRGHPAQREPWPSGHGIERINRSLQARAFLPVRTASCLRLPWGTRRIRADFVKRPVANLHLSRSGRRSVAPTSWSAVLAASSPPDRCLDQLYRLHTSWRNKRCSAWVGRPTLQPVNHPTDEDLSVGTPARRPALQIR